MALARIIGNSMPRWTRDLSHVCRNIHTNSFPSLFRISPMLCAEPLKKRRKIDPAVLKMRDDRKKRKIEKQIRKLENVGNKVKPIDECEVLPKLMKEKSLRTRKLPKLSPEEIEQRVAIFKEWSRYKNHQNLWEIKMIDRLMNSQTKALDELKIVSEELYQESLKPDLLLIPYKVFGPTQTPPIENYKIVDGDYVDVTRKWI